MNYKLSDLRKNKNYNKWRFGNVKFMLNSNSEKENVCQMVIRKNKNEENCNSEK